MHPSDGVVQHARVAVLVVRHRHLPALHADQRLALRGLNANPHAWRRPVEVPRNIGCGKQPRLARFALGRRPTPASGWTDTCSRLPSPVAGSNWSPLSTCSSRPRRSQASSFSRLSATAGAPVRTVRARWCYHPGRAPRALPAQEPEQGAQPQPNSLKPNQSRRTLKFPPPSRSRHCNRALPCSRGCRGTVHPDPQQMTVGLHLARFSRDVGFHTAVRQAIRTGTCLP